MTSKPSTKSLRTPTDDEIPSLLEALGASGATTAAFARECGLSPWKLYVARRAATGRVKRPRAGDRIFARVQVVEDPAFSMDPMELVLNSGHCLRIPAGFDESTLRRLMGVLTSC